MKTFIIAAAIAVLSAVSAQAEGTVTGSALFSGGNTRHGFDQYGLRYNNANQVLDYGVALESRQSEKNGPDATFFSGRVGTSLPAWRGFTTKVNVEAGEQIASGYHAGFYGYGVKTSHQVAPAVFNVYGVNVGPFDFRAGLQHREGWNAASLNETQVSGGVAAALPGSTEAALSLVNTRLRGYQFFDRDHKTNSTGLMVTVAHKF